MLGLEPYRKLNTESVSQGTTFIVYVAYVCHVQKGQKVCLQDAAYTDKVTGSERSNCVEW